MPVIRVEKTKDYTVMSNYHLKDKNLTLKAKGLLSVILSLPDNWEYSVEGIVAICKENETAVKSALKELKQNGYLIVKKLFPNETQSKKIEYVYEVYEKPFENQSVVNQEVENQGVGFLGVENQHVENQVVEVQEVENQGQLNTYISNTKESNTQELNTKGLNTNNIYCPEPKKASEPNHETEPPIITLILNTKEEYQIFQKDISEWQELYPAVDIMQELRKMKGWCNDNPQKRKTRSGIRRFIGNWLSREQDKGGVFRKQQKNAYQSREEQIANRVSVVDTWGFPEENSSDPFAVQ